MESAPDAPTAKATPPQPEKSPATAMTKAEFTAVRGFSRKASYPGLDVLVEMLGLTGLRRSEILGLAIDDINFATGEVLVQRAVLAVRTPEGKEVVIRDKTKTASSRRLVTIPPALLDRLRRHKAFIAETAMAFGADYRRDPLLLFPELGGWPMDPDALTSKLRSLLRSAKIVKTGLQPVHGYATRWLRTPSPTTSILSPFRSGWGIRSPRPPPTSTCTQSATRRLKPRPRK